MPRLLISQEQMEREAKALEDYKKKKLKQVKDLIETVEKSWETEVEKLLDRLDQELKLQTARLFNMIEMEKLLKDMGLEEEPPPKTKKKRKTKTNTHKNHKKELIKAINDVLSTKDEPQFTSKERKPKKRGPGRPPGSKNKPKAESSTRTRKRRGPGRPRKQPIISLQPFENYSRNDDDEVPF